MTPPRPRRVAGRLGLTLDTGDQLTLHDLAKSELDALDTRERQILSLAFGLPDADPMTYREIAGVLGGTIGEERVRQIRNIALRKLHKARCLEAERFRIRPTYPRR